MQTVHLSVKGIHCPGCVGGIENRLVLLGIQLFDYDYTEKIAEIVFDEKALTVDDILSAIARMGYQATLQKGEENGTFPL